MFFVAVANIESLKYYLLFLDKYFHHKLVEFEQNRMIWTTQNLERWKKKVVY